MRGINFDRLSPLTFSCSYAPPPTCQHALFDHLYKASRMKGGGGGGGEGGKGFPLTFCCAHTPPFPPLPHPTCHHAPFDRLN